MASLLCKRHISFPHSVNLVDDVRIQALRAAFGNTGYAFYLIILERTYQTEFGMLDISNPAIRKSLIKKIGIREAKFSKILNYAFKIKLFDQSIYDDGSILTSEEIKKRISVRLKHGK